MTKPVEQTLKEALEYRDGKLYWREDWWRCGRNGMEAGNYYKGPNNGTAYIRISHRGKIYQAHRVVWLLHHGRWPEGHIDHINGDGTDNRIENLRECDNRRSMFNRPMYSNNTSGYKGVSWVKKDKRYVAICTKDRKPHRLGSFTCPIEAAMAYDRAALELHGEHARLNFPDKLSPYYVGQR